MNGRKKTSFDYSVWARRLIEGSGDEALSKPSTGLYVVATPIGNLGDISLRALRTLAGADVVACEDTRVTGALLHRYGISRPLLSYHDHNADERRPEILARLAKGQVVVLVSDAGTPLISDPGFKLVQACRGGGYAVVAVPGASALLTALCSAGLPTDRFMFAGFLPPKKAARRKALGELAGMAATLAFYEAPSRLAAALEDMAAVLGGAREAVVARELTKMFEEVRRGSLAALAAHYRGAGAPKGEIVVLVGPPREKVVGDADVDALLQEAMQRLSLRDAVAEVAKATGVRKSLVYEGALKLQNIAKK
jgi:16S rRNA (cytidine1402-2'-O)-methyltransferase